MSVSTINLGCMLTRTAHKHPDKTALVSHDGERLTYMEFDKLSNRFANGLNKTMGIGKSDHIAVISLNCIEQLVAFFGIFKSGGVAVPVNVRLAAPEMAWILEHSDTRCLIYTAEFEKSVQTLRRQCGGLEQAIRICGKPGEGDLRFHDILAAGGPEEPRSDSRGDDDAFIIYTAGTTGKPKGVEMTHNGCIWNCINWAHAGLFRENDRSMQVFPLYHVAAIGSVLTYIYLGGTLFLKKAFDPKDCMETIQREKITRWAAAPTVFAMLLQLPGIENYDTRSVTLLGSAAAIMPSEIKRQLQKVFPNARLFDTYGMTEASGGITTLQPEDFDRKTACVGMEYISLEMRVVDENDREVPTGRVGEVIFRGNNVMKGYYKNPEATEKAMRGGWMHTGDLGRLDEEGFLYIVGRKKDMIITGGENVYPREVEEVLYTHPMIAEAAVIGVLDPKWGESIKAVVALRSGEKLSEKEVIYYCRSRIAGFKCPKSVAFVDALPKNPAGKILKKHLREMFSKG